MDKTQFTENELQELEALEIRGGGDIVNPLAQIECVNKAMGCGIGVHSGKTSGGCSC